MNEEQARKWIRDGVLWLKEGATLTPTTLDDLIFDKTLNAIDTDFLWDLMWRVLSRVLESEAILVEAPDEAALAQAGIVEADWTKIMEIALAIIELIKKWRA